MIAASAATVGVLSAVGFAAGSAPWTEAIDNATKTVQADGSAPTSGQASDVISSAITGSHAASGNAASGRQLDSVRGAGAAGSSGTITAVDDSAAKPVIANVDAAKAVAAKAAAARAAAEKATAAKAAAAKASAARAASAKRAAAAKAKAAARPAKPYLVYDSVSPSSIPAGKSAAVYVNGSFAASASQAAQHGSVLWIDTNASDPAANVLDVEPGDATPTEAADWVQHRLTAHSDSVAIVYTMLSEWQQVKDKVANLPASMQGKVRYWIADPTGVPHVVAGSSATQWYWGSNYDITTANPDFAR
jgi:ABC-2 type transport system ATP-binding protein